MLITLLESIELGKLSLVLISAANEYKAFWVIALSLRQ